MALFQGRARSSGSVFCSDELFRAGAEAAGLRGIDAAALLEQGDGARKLVDAVDGRGGRHSEMRRNNLVGVGRRSLVEM